MGLWVFSSEDSIPLAPTPGLRILQPTIQLTILLTVLVQVLLIVLVQILLIVLVQVLVPGWTSIRLRRIESVV